jgi:branched-chain amino acid transport system ATP-binding protein
VLRVDEVSVRFGGIKALDLVSFEVEPGMVSGLIGPNGAGKTTAFNVITGLIRPSAGKVWLHDRDITTSGSKSRARAGIGRTFQRLETFGSLSVKDNVMVALESRRGLCERGRRTDRCHELLEQVGLADRAETQAHVLPTGMARLLELARALACQPEVLLLDEASSGLDDHESARFGDLLTELAGTGMAILLVEHDIDLVMRICRRIHVLDFGVLIASGDPDQIQNDPAVRSAYLGTPDDLDDASEVAS